MPTSSTAQFFEAPILNSPYAYPEQHWELDRDGQPTNRVLKSRRQAEFITPIPKPKKRRKQQDEGEQQVLALFDTEGISDTSQSYDLSLFINSVREKVNDWRQLTNPIDWKVTPETAKLLQHWRQHKFQSIRPFFCQLGPCIAMETKWSLRTNCPVYDDWSSCRKRDRTTQKQAFRALTVPETAPNGTVKTRKRLIGVSGRSFI